MVVRHSLRLSSFVCALIGIMSGPALAEPDHAEALCAPGFVWRMGGPEDRVCVTPQAQQLAQQENLDARFNVEPNGGAYGPNTCRPGFVWRSGFPGDVACVTPQARDRVAQENSQGLSRRANTGQSLTTAPAQSYNIPLGGLPNPQTYVPGALAGRYRGDGVAPGLYKIKALHSGLCAGVADRGNGTRYLAAQDCQDNGPQSRSVFALVPSKGFGRQPPRPAYTLRPVASAALANAGNNGLYCAGLAKDVVFGPRAIDVNECRKWGGETEPGFCKPQTDAEQQFEMVRIGNATSTRYRFVVGSGTGGPPEGRCITVRDTSIDSGAEHISWDCHTDAYADNYYDQVFELVYVAPLPPRLASCTGE